MAKVKRFHPTQYIFLVWGREISSDRLKCIVGSVSEVRSLRNKGMSYKADINYYLDRGREYLRRYEVNPNPEYTDYEVHVKGDDGVEYGRF